MNHHYLDSEVTFDVKYPCSQVTSLLAFAAQNNLICNVYSVMCWRARERRRWKRACAIM